MSFWTRSEAEPTGLWESLPGWTRFFHDGHVMFAEVIRRGKSK